jgi:NAD(P)-dependent dehydrogenase (short-subunit alcohol dehydrogenase family)
MNDKLYLVTGATSGIGKATARALAAQGAHVVVGGRNRQKAEKTVAWIKAETGNEAVDYLLERVMNFEKTVLRWEDEQRILSQRCK